MTITPAALDNLARSGRAYVYVALVERELRSLVIARLGDGDDSILEEQLRRADSGALERAKKLRQQSAIRGAIVDSSDDSDVAFFTLPELRNVIDKTWTNFADVFGDKRAFAATFTQLEAVRNSLAHNRTVSNNQLERLENECAGLLKMVMGEDDESSVVEKFLPRDVVELLYANRYLDVVGVYSDRGHLQRSLPIDQIIERASSLNASGLSLNMIAQLVSERKLRALESRGFVAKLLLLDPSGESIRSREQEEGYGSLPVLRNITEANLAHLIRVSRLGSGGLQVRTYDETIRINYYCIDDEIAVIQPYLSGTRGVESPSLVIRNTGNSDGLFDLFAEQFNDLWMRAKIEQ